MPALQGSQALADPEHHVAGIVPALSDPPQPKLFGKVAGRLTCQRRICRTEALPLLAVASGTGEQPSACVALMVERQRLGGIRAPRSERQASVVEGHGLALPGVQLLRDPAHLLMISSPIGIGFELPLQISGIKAGQAGRARSVAAAIQTMTGEARVARPGFRPAEGDDPAILGKAVERTRLRGRTACQHSREGQGNHDAHKAATVGWWRLFPLAALALAACKPPPDQRQFVPTGDVANGKAVIERVGCASCHSITGVRWPEGKVGPPLHGLAERALIAGRLPNRPDVLAAFIRNAPAVAPGSGMPAMPISEAESRDIAAYLYEQGVP